MPAISLIDHLRTDYPEITFRHGKAFFWSPLEKTVYYENLENIYQLLHETGHAVLDHTAFRRDIRLVAMERDAWHKAAELAEHYDLTIPVEIVDDALDSYRDWLYARSTCPKCGMTGVQRKESEYHCPACLSVWHVNDARLCRLQRTIKK